MRLADRRRRTGALLIVAGLLCAVGAGATLRAPRASAAELFSFDLRGTARGVSFFGGFGGQDQATGFPEATATLTNGPIGYGLASMAWPGTLAGNPGQLMNVLQPGCAVTGPVGVPAPNPVCPAPDAAAELQYPVKAEARTGQDPPTTTNEEVPGTSMTATAVADEVSAEAKVAGLAGTPGELGRTVTQSVVKNAGDTGTAEALSQVENVEIAGVLAIESVRSTASASTDGATATGDATTTITGLSVAGQAVDFGPNGLVVADQAVPVHEVVGQVSQQVLSQMGMEIIVGPPVKEVDGASATMTAGSVVITWDTPDGLYGFVFGGAQASVTGAPDLGIDLGGIDPEILGGSTAEFGAVAPGPVGGGAVTDVGGGAGGGAAPSAPEARPSVSLDSTPAFDLSGTPISPFTALLAVLAAALLAIGMRRLGTGALAETSLAVACPLEADQ